MHWHNFFLLFFWSGVSGCKTFQHLWGGMGSKIARITAESPSTGHSVPNLTNIVTDDSKNQSCSDILQLSPRLPFSKLNKKITVSFQSTKKLKVNVKKTS